MHVALTPKITSQTITFNMEFMLIFLARLDGTNKSIKHTTIEDYLQMDGWEPPPTSTNGKKRVCIAFYSSIIAFAYISRRTSF